MRRNLAIAGRREPRGFLICDAALNIFFTNVNVEQTLDGDAVKERLKDACRQALLGDDEILCALDDENVVRIVPLGIAFAGRVAVFIDNFSHRGSIFETAKTFRLTKRESEVLRLMIIGKSNAQISALLFVAESTVSDHVKSVMRKLGVKKRLEIFSKLFNLEYDFADEPS